MFFWAINEYRRKLGLPTLQASIALTQAAQWHVNDLGAKALFSHTDSLGRDPGARIRAFGYTYNTWWGENIAAGYPSGCDVFNAWRNSPGHDANMRGANYRVIGIGKALGRSSMNPSQQWMIWSTPFGGVVDATVFVPDPARQHTLNANNLCVKP